MSTEAPSARTRVRRLAARADYAPSTVEGILDEGYIAHVAVTTPQGPLALPMAYARVGRTIYFHGAAGNAVLKAAAEGEISATVTHLDGLVLARSAFHHSMNYRSVVVRGQGRSVTEPEEKNAALAAMVERVQPGRPAMVRPPSPSELRATHVLALDLAESSAKCRSGPPVDDDDDLEIDVWAGVVPLALVAGEPVVDDQPRPAPGPAV